jgi:hypothetical protein
MTSIHRAVQFLAVLAMVGAAFVGKSEGGIISVLPSTQTIAPGGTASVDIVLSGLAAGETVGGFSLLLSFNNSILGTPDSFVNNPDGKMGLLPLDLSPGFTGGSGSPLSLYYLADGFITEPNLKLAEGAGFRLAMVNFTGLAEGLSPLTLGISPLTGVFLSDYLGTGVIPASAVNASVCVDNPSTAGDPCATQNVVPEPGTIALLGTGVAALVVRRRRQARSSA